MPYAIDLEGFFQKKNSFAAQQSSSKLDYAFGLAEFQP